MVVRCCPDGPCATLSSDNAVTFPPSGYVVNRQLFGGVVRLELMGTAEVAALLCVSRQRVLKIAAEPHDDTGFPEPLAVLSMGKVWDGSQVRNWAKGYTPRTRRDPPPSDR